MYMSGGQNYLLPAMDIAKVGGPLSVVKVCMCEDGVSVSGWSPIGCEGFCTTLISQVHSRFSHLIIWSVTHMEFHRNSLTTSILLVVFARFEECG